MTDEINHDEKMDRLQRLAPRRRPDAAIRATDEPNREAIREHEGEEGRLTRQRRRTDDRFFIDKRIIPAGLDYEWKRESVYGKPDIDHQAQLKENHWTPVQAVRHPSLATQTADGFIRKDGMILMQRPDYLTLEARKEDLEIADSEVQSVVDRHIRPTPQNTFTRDHPSARAATRVNRGYVPLQVPEE